MRERKDYSANKMENKLRIWKNHYFRWLLHAQKKMHVLRRRGKGKNSKILQREVSKYCFV